MGLVRDESNMAAVTTENTGDEDATELQFPKGIPDISFYKKRVLSPS